MGEVAEGRRGQMHQSAPSVAARQLPYPLRDRGAFLFLLYWVFAFRVIVCYNIMTEISHPKGETI